LYGIVADEGSRHFVKETYFVILDIFAKTID